MMSRRTAAPSAAIATRFISSPMNAARIGPISPSSKSPSASASASPCILERSMPDSPITVNVTRLPHGADLPLPHYATADSAGLDLLAAVADELRLAPGERALIPCGFHMALPPGYEAQVRPRSGLANKHGIPLVNSPGTLDAAYRGEVAVPLINLGQAPF